VGGRRGRGFRGAGLATAAALAAAVAAAVALAQLLMAPPASDLRWLGCYLALSGAGTLAAGWLVLWLAAAGRPGIRAQLFLGAVAGSAVGLLNVIVVARLMFVSTAHDLRLLLTLVVFSGLVTMLFSAWVSAGLGARLRAVAGVVHRLSAGDYTARVEARGGDEVAALGADVDALAAQLGAIEQQRAALEAEQRDFTVAISHDLRTPLASMRAVAEALVDGVVTERAEVERYYATLRREIERLSRMIDDLFELAQLDAGALRLQRRPVALQEIVAEVAAAMEAEASARGVALRVRVEGEPPALAVDGARLERVVSNLVSNALAHTPAGGEIEVWVSAVAGGVRVAVRDTGEGIPEEELPRVWDRFYRVERARSRPVGSSGGVGLGLAIVRGIVEAHGGNVAAQSAPGRGSTFTVQLPLAT
jgi:signal transduction histidine kinase